MAFALTTTKVVSSFNLASGVLTAYVTATNGGSDTTVTITPATLAASTGWPADQKMGSFIFCVPCNQSAEKEPRLQVSAQSIVLTCASGDNYLLKIEGTQAGVQSFGS